MTSISSKKERYARAQRNREAAANGTFNMDLEGAVAGMDRQTQLALINSVRGANDNGAYDPDPYIVPYAIGGSEATSLPVYTRQAHPQYTETPRYNTYLEEEHYSCNNQEWLDNTDRPIPVSVNLDQSIDTKVGLYRTGA